MRFLTLSIAYLCALMVITAGPSLPLLMAEPIPMGAAGTSSAPDGSEMQEVKDARAKFRDRDIDSALNYLQAAVKKNSDLPPPYVLMADFFAEFNSAQGYLRSLENAVKEDPKDPEAYVRMADLALRGGRVTEADLLYQKAASLMSGFTKSEKRKKRLLPRLAGGMAAVSDSREDWPAAQKHLEYWLKLESENALALQRLARVLFKQKRAQAAYKKLIEAKKADDKVMTPEAYLAALYLEFGDKENAKTWIKAALRKAPKDEATWIFTAKMALQMEQFAEAQKRVSEALKLDSKSLEAKILRGMVALFRKDYETAEIFFEAAHMHSPSNFQASDSLALALAEQNDETKKLRALEFAQNNWRQHEKTRNAAEAASTLGWVLYKMGKVEEAERVLQASLSSGNFNADTLYYAAKVALDRGRIDNAKRLLETALKSTQPFTMKPEAKALYEQLKNP